jgi:hypothetical protein
MGRERVKTALILVPLSVPSFPLVAACLTYLRSLGQSQEIPCEDYWLFKGP